MPTADNKPNQPETEFPLLKDDYVPGVGEEAPTEAKPKAADGGAPVSTQGSKESTSSPSKPGPFTELPEQEFTIPARKLKLQTRRDFLLYGLGAAAAATGLWWLLPQETHDRLFSASGVHRLDTFAARAGLTAERKEKFLGRVLTFDDDVAEALFSPTREVPVYPRSQAKSNFLVQTDVVPPDDSFIPDWGLTIAGLKSGKEVVLTLPELTKRFKHYEQVTRLVCVEGWSAIAWWGGIRLADLVAAYPPADGTKWISMVSEVSADSNENNYYVSIDMPTAHHPQSLLATHFDGKPISFGHGAPLRLVVPMKLGLKNIKHITRIEYVAKEPADYWAEQNYSKYDGL